MRISVPIAVAVCAWGCGRPAAGQASESLGSLSGAISFRDAAHDPDGAHRDTVVSPDDVHGSVSLTILAHAGVGVGDACPDGDGNVVRATYRGALASDGAGGYRAALYPTGVTTPSGCPVARPDTHGTVDTIVSAEIAATPTTCARFCGGAARADGIAHCSATGDPVACARGVATGAGAACEARCATAAGIAGRGTIATGTMQAYDGDDLEAGNLGELHAPIVLDRLVDRAHRPL